VGGKGEAATVVAVWASANDAKTSDAKTSDAKTSDEREISKSLVFMYESCPL
jgi:hypothetical protein